MAPEVQCADSRYTWTALVLTAVLCLSLLAWLRKALDSPARSVHVAASGKPKKRDALLDNAKFVLVAGVTATHFLNMLRPMAGTLMMNKFGLPFCLRIFVFLSGVVSRSPPSVRAFRSLLWRVAVPFVGYCTVLASFCFELPFKDLPTIVQDFPKDSLLKLANKDGAAGTAWYLQALLIWRLLGFATWHLRGWLRFLIAIGVSSIIGYVKLYEVGLDLFSLTHALHSWPIFVLGQVMPWQDIVERVPRTRASAALGFALLALLFAIEAVDTQYLRFIDVMPSDQWGSNFRLYEMLDFGWNEISGPRIFCDYGAMAIFFFRGLFRHSWEMTKGLILCLLCCSRERTFFTEWGTYSLYPYLLQLFVLRCFESLYPPLWPPFLKENSETWWGVTASWSLYFLVVVGTCALLAWAPVRSVVALVLEPEWLWNGCMALRARLYPSDCDADDSEGV